MIRASKSRCLARAEIIKAMLDTGFRMLDWLPALTSDFDIGR